MTPNNTIFAPMPGGAVKVTYTGTAGTTAALSASATAVYIVTTTDAFVRINATAVADQDMYVPALTPIVLSCPKSATVSAVQVSANGVLYAAAIS
tara:strand:+ start:28 stop:312 length:285 start_codon:yes stop_codon:yes gene_type:complete